MAANNNFRVNFRVAMESRSLSQRDVADRAETSVSYVNRVLQGHVSPGLDQAEKLAKAVHFPLIALLDSPKNFSESVLTAVA